MGTTVNATIWYQQGVERFSKTNLSACFFKKLFIFQKKVSTI